MSAFEMTPVESSNVDSVGWSPDDGGTLRVRFKGPSGSLYEYRQVPESTFRALLDAKSKGKFVREVLVAQPKDYPAKKIEDEK